MPPWQRKYINFQFVPSLGTFFIRIVLKLGTKILIHFIKIFHVFKICFRKTSCVRHRKFEVFAKVLQKFCSSLLLCFHIHNISSKAPIKNQHFTVYLDSCLNLTFSVSATQLIYPLRVCLVRNSNHCILKFYILL